MKRETPQAKSTSSGAVIPKVYRLIFLWSCELVVRCAAVGIGYNASAKGLGEIEFGKLNYYMSICHTVAEIQGAAGWCGGAKELI